MRVHHAIAVAAVVIVILGVKLFVQPPMKAEADISPGINVLQIQTDYPNMKNMPTQEMHDMTFIFTD